MILLIVLFDKLYFLVNYIMYDNDAQESVNKRGVMEKIRACPICPVCGSKKFDRLKAKDMVVRCAKCGKELII